MVKSEKQPEKLVTNKRVIVQKTESSNALHNYKFLIEYLKFLLLRIKPEYILWKT